MRILLFADIHIGSISDTEYVYQTITDVIEKELCFNKTDMVVILGDYFHKLFKVNEEYVSLSINIMSYLVKMAKREKTKIRIVYGTESHEMGQYNLFNHHVLSGDVDMKVIDSLASETIGGKKILYIPEEYIDDKNKYYKKAFSREYDYIFGHGVIIEGMPMVKFGKNSKNIEKKVPHFKSGELSSISKICLFGHYHEFTDLSDGCYYLGSFFRDSFGEEAPKGYGVITDDKFEFIENTKAYVFKTYTIEKSTDVESLNVIVDKLTEVKESNADIFNGNVPGKIRIVFNTNDMEDSTFKENVKNLLSNEKNLSIVIKRQQKDELIESVKSTIDPEYDFILDDSMEIYEKIHRYMEKTLGNSTSAEDVKKYITGDLL